MVEAIRNMASLVILNAAFSAAIVEGGTMLAERYLKRRKEEGRQEVLDALAKKGKITPEERRELERELMQQSKATTS